MNQFATPATSKPLCLPTCLSRKEWKQKKKGLSPAQMRRDFQHPSLLFNGPVKWHLISMLMRMVPSLLVHRHLYAVWLERSYNDVPIRGRRKSRIPTWQSLVAALDSLCLPNLICYRNGSVRTHTHTYVDHTSLGQLSVPVAYLFRVFQPRTEE